MKTKENKRQKIIDMMRDGTIDDALRGVISIGAQAKALGISRSTLYLYLDQGKDSYIIGLSRAIARAVDGSVDGVEDALHQRALGFTGPDGRYYPPDTNACRIILQARRAATYGQGAVTISITDADRALLSRSQARKSV